MIKSRLGWMLGSALALVALWRGARSHPNPRLAAPAATSPTPCARAAWTASGMRIATGSAGAGGAGPGLPIGMSFSQFPPQLGLTTAQSVAPPAISGGTLRVLADGQTAVAADPDRDRVYVVDLTTARALRHRADAG